MGEPHSTDQPFLEHADIFLRIHEAALDRAEEQARQVAAKIDVGRAAGAAQTAPAGEDRD